MKATSTVRRALVASMATAGLPLASAQQTAGVQRKVLRYAFPVAETGFDTVKISDLYSRTVTGNMFEAMYRYDHLARPVQVRPLTAVDMPEVSNDFRTFKIRIRPGIFFADDPAFKGRKRELVAQDYVYSFQRFADPGTKSVSWGSIEELKILGLNALRKQALADRKPWDYDREVPGLRALDRFTLQFDLEEPNPRLVQTLADNGLYGALAREVVETYGEQLAAHPVGTGAFRLKSWRRSSEIVLERNPGYRERYYEDEAQPTADDAEGQALLAQFKGRRLPMIDEVVISIIEENQPRWLSFLNGRHDFMERVSEEFISMAMPGGKIAPNLAKRGIVGRRTIAPEGTLTVYNMEDPVVGGYTPDKVALRRALNLAIDVKREIEVVRYGQAIPAQSPAVPHTTGYQASFKSEMSEYDPSRARALLDLFGYVDRDGDGFREQPDGQPMKLVRRTYPNPLQRQLDALWQKNLKEIGINAVFQVAQWPENLKAAQAGRFQIWSVGSSASQLDGQGALQRLYGPSSGGANLSRFRSKEFDALYDRMQSLPDGPEREAAFLEAKRLAVVWAPYRQHVHRIYTDLTQPWFVGYKRGLFWNRWWHMVDIDNSLRPG